MLHSAHNLKLVISDIDGTLLDDEGNLPNLNRQALAACNDRGIKTCLATGRRWTTCSKLLERLELHSLIDFCILNNGMLVREIANQKILFSQEFPLTLVLEVTDLLQPLGLDPIVLGHNMVILLQRIWSIKKKLRIGMSSNPNI